MEVDQLNLAIILMLMRRVQKISSHLIYPNYRQDVS